MNNLSVNHWVVTELQCLLILCDNGKIISHGFLKCISKLKRLCGIPSLCMCKHSVSLVMSDSLQPPWTVACQAPLSMGRSRQEYWIGLPCPPPGDLPNPGIEPGSHASPALQILHHWATKEIWFTWQVYLISKHLTTSYQHTNIHILTLIPS